MLARADGHGALHHDDRAAGQVVRKLVDDDPDGAQVGVARLGRRGADGDEEEVRPVDRLATSSVKRMRSVFRSSTGSRPGS